MDNRPIGVFDSGQGGLSVVKQMIDSLKNQSVVYFGDTARVPYGTKSETTILKYAMQDVDFLLNKGVKAIVSACGTVSAYFNSHMCKDAPTIGVIKPASMAAINKSKTGHIGVISTKAAAKSGRYQKEILSINSRAKVTSVACPMFVPLVENGYTQNDNEVALKVAYDYLKPFWECDVDVLILGCTHFPLLKEVIKRALPKQIKLIDPGYETVSYLKTMLKNEGLTPAQNFKPTYKFYVSDDVENFKEGAKRFLGDSLKLIDASFFETTL